MLSARLKDFQIRCFRVKAISVDVMNNFSLFEFAMKFIFRYQAMHVTLFAGTNVDRWIGTLKPNPFTFKNAQISTPTNPILQSFRHLLTLPYRLKRFSIAILSIMGATQTMTNFQALAPMERTHLSRIRITNPNLKLSTGTSSGQAKKPCPVMLRTKFTSYYWPFALMYFAFPAWNQTVFARLQVMGQTKPKTGIGWFAAFPCLAFGKVQSAFASVFSKIFAILSAPRLQGHERSITQKRNVFISNLE